MLSKEELLDRHAQAVLGAVEAANVTSFHLKDIQVITGQAKEYDALPAVHNLHVLLAGALLAKRNVEVLLVGQRVKDDVFTASAGKVVDSRGRMPAFTYLRQRPQPGQTNELSDGWSAVFAEDNGAAYFALRNGCKTEHYPGLAVVSGSIGSILAIRVASGPEMVGTVIPRA